MIKVEHINKSYGKGTTKVQALKDVSFEVPEGSLFGLIGPDGAGKTSLFRILTTLLLADSGIASVNHLDVVKDMRAIRNCVGYMPGRFSLYQDLTVEENLNFFATLFDTSIKENYELIKDIYVQIEPFKNRRAGKLSGGMKQKLALSCALIHRPKVLFLDEPTTGVDAVSRKEFWQMLQRLKVQGITILVSTPYMDEAALCDRVALIQKGAIMAINTPNGIVQDFSKPLWSVAGNGMLDLLRLLENFEGTERVYPAGVVHHWITKKGYDAVAIEAYLNSLSIDEIEWQPTVPQIEDCFMDLMSS